ncbi:uncharacterized protein TNIN_327021 [Trichonephila inaurata madagascariensis]|uniref:Transmembrane protein n=1 Tax=Trichonephila inaurata madagascariensis TaxID=2747483 RepID=A0A8X6Y122_9ARAC|nr:uncharacterized protein TNIN_327021 [Trichonephila inaurata madagascariensis]
MLHRRLAVILFLLAMTFANCDSSEETAASDHIEEYNAEVRGFSDYESWKPSGQSSTPDVILIKQKEPDHHHHHGSSLSSVLKDNLPLLAVLAPLAAIAVLFPLKAFLGANYVLFPPVPPPAAPMPPAARDRVGKEDTNFAETQTLAAQVLKMIDDLDRMYGETTSKQKKK